MSNETAAAGRRRHFLSLAAIIALVLVALVLVAQYGLYSLDRTTAANQDEVDRIAAMADLARAAQVSFKTEVQEWKNVLLRGHDPADYATYHASLKAREAEVDAALAALRSEAAILGFESATLAGLAAGHAALVKAYDDALVAFAADDPLSNRAVDTAVRGQDRPINDGFDALVTEVHQFADTRRDQLRHEVAEVSSRMSLILYASLAVGILVLGLAAFTAMRRDRPS